MIPDRAFLEDRERAFTERFEGAEVPRPEHWGGIRIVPRVIEVWGNRHDRIHDRFRFTVDADAPNKLKVLASTNTFGWLAPLSTAGQPTSVSHTGLLIGTQAVGAASSVPPTRS